MFLIYCDFKTSNNVRVCEIMTRWRQRVQACMQKWLLAAKTPRRRNPLKVQSEQARNPFNIVCHCVVPVDRYNLAWSSEASVNIQHLLYCSGRQERREVLSLRRPANEGLMQIRISIILLILLQKKIRFKSMWRSDIWLGLSWARELALLLVWDTVLYDLPKRCKPARDITYVDGEFSADFI